MRRKDFFRLTHMLDSCHAILNFMQGRSRSDLDQDRMLSSAVIRELQVIGEAAGKVSRDTQHHYHLPWHHLVGMRNRLIHSYFVIDEDVIWVTIKKDIPYIKQTLEHILEKNKSRIKDFF